MDAAETLYNELYPFFKHHKTTETENGMAAPTKMKAKRDFNSLIHGKHDGKIVVENIKPKMIGGKRKIVDETYKDTASFKETEEGDLM